MHAVAMVKIYWLQMTKKIFQTSTLSMVCKSEVNDIKLKKASLKIRKSGFMQWQLLVLSQKYWFHMCKGILRKGKFYKGNPG